MASSVSQQLWKICSSETLSNNIYDGLCSDNKCVYFISNHQIVMYSSCIDTCTILNSSINNPAFLFHSQETKRYFIHNNRKLLTITNQQFERPSHIRTPSNRQLRNCIIIPSTKGNVNVINRQFGLHDLINNKSKKMIKVGELIPDYPGIAFFGFCQYDKNGYYVVGGECDSQQMNTVYSFNAAEQRSYATDITLPVPLSHPAVTCFGHKKQYIAIFGGDDGNLYNHDGNENIYVFNKAEKRWFDCDVALPFRGARDLSAITMSRYNGKDVVDAYICECSKESPFEFIPEVLRILMVSFAEEEMIHLLKRNSILHSCISTDIILDNLSPL